MSINLSAYFANALYDDGNGQRETQYKLTLFDTEFGPEGPDWVGTWTPENIGDDMVRSAESWAIAPTRKNAKHACKGTGDFGATGLVLFVITRVAP